MAFKDFLEHLFFKKNGNKVSLNAYSADDEDYQLELWAYRLALNIVCQRIGALLSKCEWKTYVENKETEKDNYYLLNNEPNPNQTAAEFRQQLINQLIMSDNHDALIVKLDNVGKYEKSRVKEAFYVAENFHRNQFQLVANSFDQVSVNVFGDESYQLNGTFSGGKAIYIKYQNSELDAIFAGMKATYAKLIENAEKAGTYRQKYALELDQTAMGMQDFEKSMQTLLNDQFDQFIKGDNAVIPLYAGMKLNQTSAGADLGQNASVANKNVDTQIDEILVKTGLAFNIPKSVMNGDFEKDDLDHMLVYCIDPIANMITEAFNRKWYGKEAVQSGTYCRIDTTKCRHFDIVTVSDISNNAISSGIYTINEIRKISNEIPTDKEIGDKHFITRNYAVIGDYLQEEDAYSNYQSNKKEMMPDDYSKSRRKNTNNQHS